jgi:aspartate beta-hydroxylase
VSTPAAHATAMRRQDVERSLSAGDIPRALELSAAWADAEPGNPDALTLRAAALMASDNAPAAVNVLAAPVARGDAPSSLRAALAMCQMGAGDHVSAMHTLRVVLVERPNDFAARLAYAECLDLLGDGAAALPEYFRAVHVAQQHGRWLDEASTGPAMRARVKRAMDIIDRGRKDLFEQVLQPHVDAFGREGMARVSEALAVYLGTQSAPPRDPRQQPKFFWMPGLPPTAFYDRARFDWYAALELAFDVIREELQGVLEARRDLTPFLAIDDKSAEDAYLGGDPERRAWDAFFFHRHGERFDASHVACPRTSKLLDGVPLTRVDAHAPEVLFSVLAPQTHIKPHHGVTNTRVVTHLPLVIPQGDCRLVVGGEEHAWREGRCVTFDDTLLHEAWNRTDRQRVVLILDTWNPDLRQEECIALKDLIERIGDFNARAGVA